MNGQAAANTDETLLCKVAGKGAGRTSTPPHVHGYEANTGMPHAVQLHMSHTWALSLASPVIQWAKKKKQWQQLPIGPAPNMATFLPGPTPALLHACTAHSNHCERVASHALQVVYTCLTSGTCSD